MRQFFLTLVCLGVCQCAIAAADFSTPESAIRSLEEAIISKNIDAVVAAMDFDEDARRMLLRINPVLARGSALVKQTSESMELSYRKETMANGFPDYTSVTCLASPADYLPDGLARLTETCRFADGTSGTKIFYLSKSAVGWRIVVGAP